MLLTPAQQNNLSSWTYQVEDKSITTTLLNPFWNRVVQLIPHNVAPNVLSLAGLLCLMHAYYLVCYSSGVVVSFVVALLLFSYQTLDAIDGKHARRTHNASPMGELFDHACDNVGVIFLMLTVSTILGITDLTTQWLIVQTAQLVFLGEHVEALCGGVVKFHTFRGPGEALWVFIAVILGVSIFDIVVPSLQWVIIFLYIAATADAIYQSVKTFPTTRYGLLLCIFYHMIPLEMIAAGWTTLSIWDIVSSGLCLSVVTSDIIVSKMSKRDLHPWVVIFSMISIFDNFLTLVLGVAYYVCIFTEISRALNIPIFTPQRNVLVLGVFDLFHVGHRKLFEAALQHGSSLIVGVHNDADCTAYKRAPIMTQQERCKAIRACKYVHKVLPNTPLVLTKEFLDLHNIHVVALSEEYDTHDDLYYKAAREEGMCTVLPRTQGISTSEIIARIVTKYTPRPSCSPPSQGLQASSDRRDS